MAFWSVAGPEPKRQYRWYITFKGFTTSTGAGTQALQTISYALKKCDKPKATIKDTPHDFLNHKFYYPGRLNWETINMTFASITDPDATNVLNDILLKAGYGVPSQYDTSNPSQVSTIGKRKFNGALGNTFDISQVNADGREIERWTINNPFFTSVQYGSLDYANEDIVEIQCTVRFDWAKLTTFPSEELPLRVPPGPPIP